MDAFLGHGGLARLVTIFFLFDDTLPRIVTHNTLHRTFTNGVLPLKKRTDFAIAIVEVMFGTEFANVAF